MNQTFTTTALSAAIALTLTACGGPGASDGGIAGIGGSGYISSGTVTGFGSVFVNGVEFETDSATFDVDGNSGTQDDLAIGMIVHVSGSINDDGITGTATNISYDDELQGPVTGLTAPDADGITRSFTVLGINVIIDSSSTTFDVSSDLSLPANSSFDFNSITDENNVEISGFFDASGNLKATRVELKEITFDANSIIEIKGVITGLSGTVFSLGSLTVDASTATLDDLPDGLQEGVFVEVKGTLDTASNTLKASKVEAEDDGVVDTDEFELEGIITDYVDDSNFMIDGIKVDASNAQREPASLTLADDAHVEAEGAIINGILVAKEIKSEGGDIKVHAMVSSVDLDTGTFKLRPVTGQPEITVTITTNTQLEDDVTDIEPYTLTNLFNNPGFVEVRGYEDGSGGITAVEIDVREADDVVVQGTIQSGASFGTVKVLGVEFTIDPSQTKFENINDFGIEQSVFFDTVIFDSTIIKIQDDMTADGIADEIDIESP